MSDLDLHIRIYNAEQILARLTAGPCAQDRADMAAAQRRADAVACLHGDTAPDPRPGESVLGYRKRLLERFKKHSPDYVAVSVGAYYDSATIGLIEDRIYADAERAAVRSDNSGTLRPVVTREFGRLITTFHGDVGAFLEPFSQTHGQRVKINT
jgi:hypothetical protein